MKPVRFCWLMVAAMGTNGVSSMNDCVVLPGRAARMYWGWSRCTDGGMIWPLGPMDAVGAEEMFSSRPLPGSGDTAQAWACE